MTGRNSLILLVLIAFLSAGSWSCTKKKGAATPGERILGAWRKVMYGSDDNLSGAIEKGEKHAVASQQNEVIVFNEDGTGKVSYSYNGVASPDISFTWKIITDGAVWVAYHTNDTVAYHLEEVSSQDLTLTTQGAITLEWYYYVRD